MESERTAPISSQDFFERATSQALREIFGEDPAYADFNENLPLIFLSKKSENPLTVSVYVISRFRFLFAPELQEIVIKSLLALTHLNISRSFFSDFRLPEIGTATYTLHLLVIYLEEERDFVAIQESLPDIKTQLLAAFKINSPPLTHVDKTRQIQEKICYFVRRFPLSFDREIIDQMDHFFITSASAFREERSNKHLVRIIYNFYLFKKKIGQQIVAQTSKRYIEVSVRPSTLLKDEKSVLAVFVGMNFLKENELFDEKHLLRSFQRYLPDVRLTPGSFFCYNQRNCEIHIVYVEVEKEGGEPFSAAEIELLRGSLPIGLKNQVAYLISPVFMPRNEEEVMRNLIILSGQVRGVKDPVQLMVSFDQQIGGDILFTLVLARMRESDSEPLGQLIKKGREKPLASLLNIEIERVKIMGDVAPCYQKEAAVLRARLPQAGFVREDHSIDLYKARLYLVQACEEIFGRVRDYNGGLYLKEMEVFRPLKELISDLTCEREFLLENLFHSIYPAQLKWTANPALLKKLFLLILEQVDLRDSGDGVRIEEAPDGIYACLTKASSEIEEALRARGGVNLLCCALERDGIAYSGYLYFSEELAAREEMIALLKGLSASTI